MLRFFLFSVFSLTIMYVNVLVILLVEFYFEILVIVM
jgi:hypothetical protein